MKNLFYKTVSILITVAFLLVGIGCSIKTSKNHNQAVAKTPMDLLNSVLKASQESNIKQLKSLIIPMQIKGHANTTTEELFFMEYNMLGLSSSEKPSPIFLKQIEFLKQNVSDFKPISKEYAEELSQGIVRGMFQGKSVSMVRNKLKTAKHDVLVFRERSSIIFIKTNQELKIWYWVAGLTIPEFH